MIATIERLQLEPKRLPLITNYPSFRKWNKKALEDKVGQDPMCIYVHIPFCTQRCSFCYYKTVDLKEYRPEVDTYVEMLCEEINRATDRFQLGDRPIKAVYFGGGTPSLLTEIQTTKIVDALRRNFKHFDSKDQFSFEAEPLTISRSKMETLKSLGVTRLSMGMQSFVDDIIKLSGRGHDEKQAYRAIEIAQEVGAGQWNINIDLLSGLAGETPETWNQSVKRAIATGVESITVYKMEAFANTEVFDQGVRKDEVALPTDDQEMAFMAHAMDCFEEANYLPWSFFTYTKNGCDESQYISSIWRGMDFYGFGVSAFGSLGDHLIQNTSDLEKYPAMVGAGELPLTRGYRFTTWDQMVREVLMGVKLLSFDLKGFKERHGVKLQSLCSAVLPQLEADGFVKVSSDELTLTNKGILYGDYVGQLLSDTIKNLH
ncbi:coproporphyrinogen-III oxidase family protein [Prochlorothrix hollandica]|uniref:Heme chaperone HemW n=1 Tax=Prochlorothrix hollandica PCC 9006 = CALU 1027 TaxID=317619 RepID=A0A0M2PVL9_PROHO|nr:coproporphyrinogen-III oxidase family protein [Prochlorothrix hollandica]KKI98406.1 coproporphyrinogen III oxidase [Prochlorothrix hollandica PCC 9006 = CALU 1027]